ncbi:YbaB/EbfC family nucleoid-associated protein [Candidatus Parcubacteria bacterium]|nr:YbaB/EbfC family nucleoid-associated protein [Candidatus Parcubacteria bacterium]
MFNKLKQLKDLRSQAKKMQSALSGETITSEKNGVSITMDGNMSITSVVINPDLAKESMETAIKIAANDTIKKTQKLMAKKMQEMGGFPGMG